MRLAIDTGGTFTDLVVEDDGFVVHKRPTTPHDPPQGILDVIAAAARARDQTVDELLGSSEMLIHATTHSLNALLTGNTARTAFLTSQGHRDILTLREGGREHFNVREPYPDPYVPRSLTFEVPGRVAADGDVVAPLDEAAVIEILDALPARGIEAIGVCLLWTMVNPAHEIRVGELIAERLPGIPYTLSHELSPTLREFRRASATVIDASLKPLMTRYLTSLSGRLRDAGFGGRLLMVTSSGSLLDMDAVARAPIHSIKSGPAMSPVAGRHFAATELDNATAIVADTGGTSYDVSVVRDSTIPWTRETWLGRPYLSAMTGFPSVDVRSYGAGGGSIAWVDDGGLLRIGPMSAGADPGPAAYGRGGTRPTVTDASLVLGHLDAGNFLGGALCLDRDAASAAVEKHLAQPLGLDVTRAAAAVLELATEEMVRAIEDAVVRQGIDPRSAVLVGGGGAAGLNAVGIARRMGCPRVLIPAVSAALSAAGALMSDLAQDFRVTRPTRTDDFDHAAVTALLAELRTRGQAFIDEAVGGAIASGIELFAEAHYAREVWEIEVPVEGPLDTPAGVAALKTTFDRLHEELYAVADVDAPIEIVSWRAHAWCRVRPDAAAHLDGAAPDPPGVTSMAPAFFMATGWVETDRYDFDALEPGREIAGPAIVTSPVTTTVIDPGARAIRTTQGGLSVQVQPR